MKKIGEKCAVFGVYGKGMDVARLAFFGLFALQHRGQEGSGIAVTDGKKISCHKREGLMAQVFNEDIIKNLGGSIDVPSFAAIGHNRYSTSAGGGAHYVQPVIAGGVATCKVTIGSDNCTEHAISEYFDNDGVKQTIALVHNGNIPSVTALTDFLKEKNVDLCNCAPDPCIEKTAHNHKIVEGVCITPSDSTLITEALAWYVGQGLDIEDAVKKVFPLMTGTFSILVMTKNKMIAIRDAHGVRPFSVAKLNGGFVFSSETCAFIPIGATHLRDVEPGEMIVVDDEGMRSETLAPANQKLDIFEFVYFSRPDSILLGQSIYGVRKRFGEILARETKIEADVVIPVPETAMAVGIGFANASGIPFEMGLVKSRYINRTFIQPEQHIRDQGVKLKLSPLKEVIDGKRVVVIDDSLVRGTTSRQIVKMLFEAGAKEVHYMLGSAPIKYPDFYGIDIPKQKDLLASSRTIEEMNTYLGSTSLHFLSFEGMIEATGIDGSKFCTSCFTGEYPIDIKERILEVDFTK
ncbi:MAG: purF [Candidatus Taylorbacteria bacterium]|nr:purF [Candidatus Taylorbacteria bacterium]